MKSHYSSLNCDRQHVKQSFCDLFISLSVCHSLIVPYFFHIELLNSTILLVQ